MQLQTEAARENMWTVSFAGKQAWLFDFSNAQPIFCRVDVILNVTAAQQHSSFYGYRVVCH